MHAILTLNLKRAHRFLTGFALPVLIFFSANSGVSWGQGILPPLMYGVYALDETCDAGARHMVITPTDIVITDPGLDIRISYPDQRHIWGDEIALVGNFFVSVRYDGALRRTPTGALMSFNFPDLSFPLLEPLMKRVLGEGVPTAIQADLNLVNQDQGLTMSLTSKDPNLGKRLSDLIGIWIFDAEKITRVRGSASSTYPRCFDGKTAREQHASLIDTQTGVYSRDGECRKGGQAFVVAVDGWGLSIPFADPTIGFAFSRQGSELVGELYRAPFAPLAPDENSYIDIEVRDGALHHHLNFSGESLIWDKALSNGEREAVGTYGKCSSIGETPFATVMADIDAYLNEGD